MRMAIRLALENINNGGGPFGAVIVKDGEVVSTGVNRVTAHHDPTAHAEVQAIREACRKMGTFSLDGCSIYTSCEPCPMCLGAIYWARLSRVFCGCTKVDADEAGFSDDFIYKELDKPNDERQLVQQFMLNAEARETFRAWAAKTDRVDY